MSVFMNGVNVFEGIQTFPHEPDQLLHHLSRVNHTLQARYYIAPEIAEFALQPDKDGDFQKFYQKEVQQIVAHLNEATGGNLSVRVDGARIAKGLEIVRDGANSRPANGDAAWQASMTATARKLAEQQVADHQSLVAHNKGATPAYSSREHMDELLMSTNARGNGVVDSMAKPPKDSFLFTTPPEFKGFQNAPTSTPSESDGRSPTAY